MNWLPRVVLAFSISLPYCASAATHRRTTKHRPRRAAPAASSLSRFTKAAVCKVSASPKKVMIIKQWHLGPKIATRTFKEKYPQERNQTAIYQALASEIRAKRLQVVVGEGCGPGEIDSSFKKSWNGWDYNELHKVSQTKGYDKIITQVPLKLEARFEDGVKTLCGDDDKLVQEGNLRLSNLRGWLNFSSRLREKYVDDKGKMYSDAAADLLKIPRSTPLPQILKKVDENMREDLMAFKQSLKDRNTSFVKTLTDADFSTAAVVIGGLHAEDLKSKVEAAGLNCEVLEPPGYQREDEQLLVDFERAIPHQ